ncbi:DUF2232 domain-containing protein [Magnetofaba australis]|uniref:DUF2232 domain-containing protein n=1 Tax=Magnetofaba australis IT-1 TaxID=1434232 RepID=A0A1Y2K3F1_9PROT|nr:DUF2232 domain-containing protein [Magnetofaba australis]OSM02580.1 hypothetical protein MAIT1_02757 [Magnetofaba australis IT-1]
MKRLTANPYGAGLLTALCLVLPLYAPAAFFPLLGIAGLPVFLAGLQGDAKSALIALGLGVTAQTLVTSDVQALGLTLVLIGVAPVVGAWLMRRGWRFFHLASGCYLLALAALLLMVVFAPLFGAEIESAVRQALQTQEASILQTLENSKGVAATDLANVQAELRAFFDIIARFFPLIVVQGWLLIQLVTMGLGALLMKRWEPQFPLEFSAFRAFAMPFNWVWPAIVLGLAAAFLPGDSFIGAAALNLVFFWILPYLAQGVAIAEALFAKRQVGGWVRGVFYAALIWWVEFNIAITMVGVFDSWFHFRERFKDDD